MSTATDRLALLLAAEVKILQGQEVRHDLGDGRGYRMLRMADYAEVRQAIKDVQREVAAQTANARGGFSYALVNLSGND